MAGGRTERGFFPAVVETARIVNVNINDWSVDAVGEYGNRRFFDVQVMSPYLHYFNGEGIYAMPEVGAMCWICQASTGLMANHFVLGFQAPVDERVDKDDGKQAGNFRANRQNLNPGDIMLRTRDENFVILRRGGVVQIGATPMTQRMYIPIGNIIRDFCESYNLFTLAGDMEWVAERVDQDDAGDVKTRFLLRCKTKANEPEHAVVLALGSQKDDPDVRLSLLVNETGETGAPTVVNLEIDKAGNVTWLVMKDFFLTVEGQVAITSKTKDVFFESVKGKATLKSKSEILLQSTDGAASLLGKGDVVMKSADGNATIKGKTVLADGKVDLGMGASEPLVLGTQLVSFLSTLISIVSSAGVAGGIPVIFPGLAALTGQLTPLLSQNSKTK